MTDLNAAFERHKKLEQEMIDSAMRLVEAKQNSVKMRCLACMQDECGCDTRCLACYSAPCACKPGARMDVPYDMGFGV